jgi:sugar lactone lactonase YvrE
MRMLLNPLASLLLLTGAAIGGEPARGEVSFAAKPVVKRNGGGTHITFAVSRSTDVEVAILDKQGRVVRHLAAGVLGGTKAPPPPLKPGLSQDLTWDGMDDLGRSVLGEGSKSGGPFKVRVRLGMSVKFGRIIGTSPYTGTLPRKADANSVAVGPNGDLYLRLGSMVRSGQGWHLRRFGRDGKYRKTLLPYAPSTEPKKARGYRLIDAGDGLLTPANRSAMDPVFMRLGRTLYPRLVNGSVVFIDTGAARMTFFKIDGSNAIMTVPMRTSKEKLQWRGHLSPQIAFSPDGRYAYYSNVAKVRYDTKKPSDIDPKFPQGRVYRHDLSKPGSDPEKFYDLKLPDWKKTKYWMPNAWNKKTAAAGVDVDAQGNLYVCDLVNQEVVKVSPEGKKLSAVKVPWPDKVLVSSKSDSLYVISSKVSKASPGYGRPASLLLKLDGRGAGAKVVAKLVLHGSGRRIQGAIGQSFALDESGEKPVIWVGGRGELYRVEDRGTEFAKSKSNFLNPDRNAIAFVAYGDVDVDAELVYITMSGGAVWRYNGDTGKGGRAPISTTDLAVGPGGMIYAWGTRGWNGPVVRYTRRFKPAPLKSTGKNSFDALKLGGRLGRGASVPGIDVDLKGRVYISHGVNAACVQVLGADGKVVEFKRRTRHFSRKPLPAPGIPVLIGGMQDMSGSLRVDLQGNVYVLQLGQSEGHVPPKGFEKEPSYLKATGTIHKFGPEGGEFGGRKSKHRIKPVAGVLRSYGTPCGTVSGAWGSGGSVCHCAKPRFDVDGYGRLYIPNTFTYKVAVIDNADNPMASFGGYGNWDARGPKSAEPKPEIPLGWPIFAGASEKYIYVGDALNHRVVRVDKQFAAEESCELK